MEHRPLLRHCADVKKLTPKCRCQNVGEKQCSSDNGDLGKEGASGLHQTIHSYMHRLFRQSSKMIIWELSTSKWLMTCLCHISFSDKITYWNTTETPPAGVCTKIIPARKLNSRRGIDSASLSSTVLPQSEVVTLADSELRKIKVTYL